MLALFNTNLVYIYYLYHWVFFTLNTSSPIHLLIEFNMSQCVRKEGKCVEAAIRPGALKVRDATTLAYKRQQPEQVGGERLGQSLELCLKLPLGMLPWISFWVVTNTDEVKV